MMAFELHPRLKADAVKLGQTSLSEVLLMNDQQYPWLILVPRYAAAKELYELSEVDQQQFMRESSYIARQLQTGFNADKINIASLGNVVSQLHIHHIVRFINDPAWPGPIWGAKPPIAYTEHSLRERVHMLKKLLHEMVTFDD